MVLFLLLAVSSVCKPQNSFHTRENDGASVLSDLDVSENCPPWTYKPASDNTCRCANWTVHELVYCSVELHNNTWTATLTLPLCYCVSFNDLVNTSVVGYCAARCSVDQDKLFFLKSPGQYQVQIGQNSNSVDTNRAICKDMNRTGQMCGSCEKGYAPPVYSYSLKCVNCSNYSLNWLKYIAIAYLPLTVFYLFVILFRISATSPRLHGYITTCQLLVTPNLLRMISELLIHHLQSSEKLVACKIVITFYSIWNLDFFRSVFPPFCIHPNLTTLETYALDYAVALYPLLLIVLTYTLVTLHDHYIVVVRMWRPFYKCFRFFREEWDLRASLVSAFATFILLSYVKILNTSLDLLAPLTLYDMNGNTPTPLYLGIDGTVKYFGRLHMPYALLALIMCSVFNILPLVLLCLYPCRCFHRCLNRFKLHSQTVHTFIEVFQGCFKTHPRDYRHFAAFYILLRIVNVALSTFISGISLVVVVMAVATMFIAIAKPYKSSLANISDIVMFLFTLIILYYIPTLQLLHTLPLRLNIAAVNYGILLFLAAHFAYGVCILIFTFLPKSLVNCLKSVYKKHVKGRWNSSPEKQCVPDRLVHPDDPEYAPLIAVEQSACN